MKVFEVSKKALVSFLVSDDIVKPLNIKDCFNFGSLLNSVTVGFLGSITFFNDMPINLF